MSEIDSVKDALRTHGLDRLRRSAVERRRARQIWSQLDASGEAILRGVEQGTPFVVSEAAFALLAASDTSGSDLRQRLLALAGIERDMLGQKFVIFPAAQLQLLDQSRKLDRLSWRPDGVTLH